MIVGCGVHVVETVELRGAKLAWIVLEPVVIIGGLLGPDSLLFLAAAALAMRDCIFLLSLRGILSSGTA